MLFQLYLQCGFYFGAIHKQKWEKKVLSSPSYCTSSATVALDKASYNHHLKLFKLWLSAGLELLWNNVGKQLRIQKGHCQCSRLN